MKARISNYWLEKSVWILTFVVRDFTGAVAVDRDVEGSISKREQEAENSQQSCEFSKLQLVVAES